MTKINLEYFGMPGSGATVKEAKADAGAAIERALKGDYAPVLVRYRNCVAVMSRDPQVWGYRFLHGDAAVQTASHCSTDTRGRDECLLSMLSHIADVERLDTDTDPPTELFSALPARLQRDAERNWHGRTAWYRECAEAKAVGKVFVGGSWVMPAEVAA